MQFTFTRFMWSLNNKQTSEADPLSKNLWFVSCLQKSWMCSSLLIHFAWQGIIFDFWDHIHEQKWFEYSSKCINWQWREPEITTSRVHLVLEHLLICKLFSFQLSLKPIKCEPTFIGFPWKVFTSSRRYWYAFKTKETQDSISDLKHTKFTDNFDA